jgi:hypothetical protein
MRWEEGAFVAIAVLVAILVIDPLVEKGIQKLSPTYAAKLGIGA